MKAFFLRRRGLHLWLAADLLALALFYLLRGNTALMNTLADSFTAPARRVIAAVTYRTSLSLMEVLCAALVLLVASYALWTAIAVFRAKGHRRDRLYGALLGAACFGLSIWAAFCLLCGNNC